MLSRMVLALFAAAAVASAAVSAPAPPAPLTPSERDLIVQALAQADHPPAAAADDAGLVRSLLGYARTQLGQRIQPSSVEHMWAIQPQRHDVAAEFEAARGSGSLAAWIQALPPPAAPYHALEAARARYQGIVAAGGWAALPAASKGPALKEGQRGPQVALLRARLAAEGYGAADAADPELFDPALREALAAFQAHHNLPEDGSLGADTRAALNVPAQERLMQIEANLERWRWMPRRMPAERIEVDIGGAEAALIRPDEPTLSMKIVVGDPRHHTPMFASRVDSVVFNPPWRVPDSIAAKEIFPKARRDPGYLARGHFILQGGRIIQLPGPKNSLGQIKLDLPSPFGVYLHDTPVKSAFQKRNRALSHGCMRLEKPREIALALLSRQGWTAEMMEAAIAKGSTQVVRLDRTTPLYVAYWTAVVAPDNAVSFRPDVYGWDRKLVTALGPAAP